MDVFQNNSLSDPLNEGHTCQNMSGYFISLWQPLLTYRCIHNSILLNKNCKLKLYSHIFLIGLYVLSISQCFTLYNFSVWMLSIKNGDFIPIPFYPNDPLMLYNAVMSAISSNFYLRWPYFLNPSFLVAAKIFDFQPPQMKGAKR